MRFVSLSEWCALYSFVTLYAIHQAWAIDGYCVIWFAVKLISLLFFLYLSSPQYFFNGTVEVRRRRKPDTRLVSVPFYTSLLWYPSCFWFSLCVCVVYFFLLVSHLFFSPQKLFNVSVVFLNHSGVPDYVPAVIRVLFIDCVKWCDFVPLLQLFILILFFMLYCHSAKHSGSVIINLMHMDASRTTKEVEAGAGSCAD